MSRFAILDSEGRKIATPRLRDALRSRKAQGEEMYVDVFGTSSEDPEAVLRSDHNASNVAALLDGSYIAVG